MSVTLSRSTRLMLKDKGAPVPAKATIQLRGQWGGIHMEPTIAAKMCVQSMEFFFYWREKDYGDAVMENWYFTIRAKTNIPDQDLTFSFWRNYVYFTPTHIFFGYYNSHNYIYKKGDQAFFHEKIFTSEKDYLLAVPFEEVVAKMKAGLEDCAQTVRDSEVYSFPLGEVTVRWLDQHRPPTAHISFL